MFRVRVHGGKNERRLAVKKVFEVLEVFFFFQEKFLLIPFQPVIPMLMAYETRRFYSDISIRGPVEALDWAPHLQTYFTSPAPV